MVENPHVNAIIWLTIHLWVDRVYKPLTLIVSFIKLWKESKKEIEKSLSNPPTTIALSFDPDPKLNYTEQKTPHNNMRNQH